MNFKEKLDRINKRWNIQMDESPEEGFRKFKVRICNILVNIDSQVREDDIPVFCRVYGIVEKWEHSTVGDRRWSKNIINRLVSENDEFEFYKLLEIIFALDIPGVGSYAGTAEDKWHLYRQVLQAIELSNVNLATSVTEEDEVIFFPKGEPLLDEELVNSAFTFLAKQSSEHFVQALKDYQANKHIKSAEELRRSLEEFLRMKLNNRAGLNANISEVTKRLKDDGRDPQVRKIILQACGYLDQYFNENSKHNDGEIDEMENEFLIYQVGVLMRYLNRAI